MKENINQSTLWRYLRWGYYSLRNIPHFIIEFMFKIKVSIIFRDLKLLFSSNLSVVKTIIEQDYFDNFIQKKFSSILSDAEGDIIRSIKTLRDSLNYKSTNDWVIPHLTLRSKQGDCKSTSSLLGYYLAWLKIPFDIYTEFNFKHIKTGHSYLLFYLGKKTYFVDDQHGPIPHDPKDSTFSNLIRIYSYVPR